MAREISALVLADLRGVVAFARRVRSEIDRIARNKLEVRNADLRSQAGEKIKKVKESFERHVLNVVVRAWSDYTCSKMMERWKDMRRAVAIGMLDDMATRSNTSHNHICRGKAGVASVTEMCVPRWEVKTKPHYDLSPGGLRVRHAFESIIYACSVNNFEQRLDATKVGMWIRDEQDPSKGYYLVGRKKEHVILRRDDGSELSKPVSELKEKWENSQLVFPYLTRSIDPSKKVSFILNPRYTRHSYWRRTDIPPYCEMTHIEYRDLITEDRISKEKEREARSSICYESYESCGSDNFW